MADEGRPGTEMTGRPTSDPVPGVVRPVEPGPVDPERMAKAMALATAYVNRRERTRAEVRGQLERKGVAEPVAEVVLRELADLHLVDDVRFATMFVADKRNLEQWGGERIRRGLRAHGIERELAERVLAAEAGSGEHGADAVSELDRALDVLRRRFPVPPTERRERDRALGVLLRKGYASELALDALAAHARED